MLRRERVDHHNNFFLSSIPFTRMEYLERNVSIIGLLSSTLTAVSWEACEINTILLLPLTMSDCDSRIQPWEDAAMSICSSCDYSRSAMSRHLGKLVRGNFVTGGVQLFDSFANNRYILLRDRGLILRRGNI